MLSKNELALCVHPSYKQIQSVKKKKKYSCSWETSIRSLYTCQTGSSLEGNIHQVFIGDRERILI